MWAAIGALGGIAFVSAFGLGIAARFFAVEIDPKFKEVEEFLPGANCGGCGFPDVPGLPKRLLPERRMFPVVLPGDRLWLKRLGGSLVWRLSGPKGLPVYSVRGNKPCPGKV